MDVSFEFMVLRFLGDFVLSADAAEDSCGALLEFDILLGHPSKEGNWVRIVIDVEKEKERAEKGGS